MLIFESPFYIVGSLYSRGKTMDSSPGLRVKGVGLDGISILRARTSLLARHCRPGSGLLRGGRDCVARPSEGI